MPRRASVVALLMTIGLLAAPTSAAEAAPSTPAWLDCPSRTSMAKARGVVLLVPGTGSTAHESFSWGYERALAADGFAVCTTGLPETGLGSLTRAALRVRKAIRLTHRLAGRRIAVIGHSQGAALPVWSVKFWKGSAKRVTDVVGLAGPFNGTQFANNLCASGECAPLAWQLRQGAEHIKALRGAPLPKRVAVTSIYSRYDEIVSPAENASPLPGAANFLLQDICAHDPSEHGLILGDPLAYALARDAITHRGPAVRRRLPGDVCTGTFIPGFEPTTSAIFFQSVARFLTGLADPNRWVDAEPPLPRYAR
jgi:pimeloyl-ACP methyl ester carboxylesterase